MNLMRSISKFAIVITILTCSCTSVASIKWVQRSGGKDRKKVWVPTCSECGHVVNYRSRQCSNPEDRRLIVWSDKDLYFDFPENPQNDYTTEQLEVIDPREQSDEVIIKEEEDVTPSETEDQEEENPINEETNENPSGVTSDFDDLDWAEDDWAEEEEGDDYVEEVDEEPEDVDEEVKDDNFDNWEDSEEVDKFLDEPTDEDESDDLISNEEVQEYDGLEEDDVEDVDEVDEDLQETDSAKDESQDNSNQDNDAKEGEATEDGGFGDWDSDGDF